jgi:hypothetical protein
VVSGVDRADGPGPGPGGDGAAEAASGGGDPCPPGRTLVFALDLSNPAWNEGPAGVTAAVQALGTTIMAGAANASVEPDPVYGRALKVAYPARSGSISCVADKQCAVDGGLVFRVPLPGGSAITSALLSYRVKFDSGFEWVKGGKLPGLCGGECSTGGRDVNPDRFSIRYMWRGGGVGTVYSYLTNPPNNGTGLDIGSGTWRWQADGQWHHIQEELVLNTGSNRDGVIRVWYDRALTAAPNFERKDLVYYDRTRYPSLGIDKLIFSTFHGGEDASWSPGRTVHAHFAALHVCR